MLFVKLLHLLCLLSGLEGAATGVWSGSSYTPGPAATVTYNPGEECLPYDGSVVPDCRKYVDENTKWSIYKEHSSNCSRFWECGPPEWSGTQWMYETCLFECAPCQNSVNPPENPMCQNNEGDNQWALTFDPSYQYPDGPVCDWPSTLACHCDLTTDPDKECCLDTDCPPQPDGCPESFCLGYKCNHLDCKELCSQDLDCPGSNSECDISQTPYGNCNYCGAEEDCQGKDPDTGCCPGCLTDPQCPDGQVCHQHLCVPDICANNEECTGYNSKCDVTTFPHGDCTYCGPDDNCGRADGCCLGCGGLPDNGNCEHPRPVCNGNHECGCIQDQDCQDGWYCDTSEQAGLCKENPICSVNSDCSGYNTECDYPTFPHTACFYCAAGDNACGSQDGCCPGCGGNGGQNCGEQFPVCVEEMDHKCGCRKNEDCPAQYPICVQDAEAGRCKVPEGQNTVERVVVTTESCTACTGANQEPVRMELVGRQPQFTCKTPELDHPGMVDFSIDNKAVFVENVDGFVEAGTCFGGDLANKVTQVSLKWNFGDMGFSGTVCIEWSNNVSTPTSVCTVRSDGSSSCEENNVDVDGRFVCPS